MRTLTLRRAALVAVAPLALGSLAACGGGNADSTTAADPQAPSSAPTSTPTSKPSHDAHAQPKQVDPAAFVDRLKAAAHSITTARFTMTMDIGGQSVQAKGTLDMSGDRPAMDLRMDLTGMGTPTDMRVVEGILYIEAPGSGGKYVKMDLSDPNGPLGGYGDALTNYDPQSMIDQMSPQTFRKVTDLGPQTIHGQQLERYRVTVDTSAATKMFQNLPSTSSLPKSITYDLWLDGQGRMARFTMLMKNVSRVTATYTDYGADVHISAPPSSAIVPMPGSAS